MQNRYVGDIGDFGKFGLLRRITCSEFTESPLPIGIFWYLVPDEDHNADGKHIAYLCKQKMRQCDPDLFEGLRRIVKTSQREFSAVEQAKLFPLGTTFFSQPLTFEGMPSNGKSAREQRLRHRRDWLLRGSDATRSAALVFFDPDNGIEISSRKKHTKLAPKYVYWDEVALFQERKQSVVIYQHLARTGGNHNKQTRSRLAEAEEELPYGKNAFALRYRRGTSRAFIIIPTHDHLATIQRSVDGLMNSPWHDHFTYIAKLFCQTTASGTAGKNDPRANDC